ncbi:hypothetical protein ACJRO7_011223 [Eucalyptus globulus]|uniref:BCAS3 domain-containing protein n=1 Tax=Eucalyptus globulus TaxID=34317 RepID=A0ABD3LJY2_EUCGL
MKSYGTKANGSFANHKSNTNGFLPNSLKFISSCIKTASSGVRSAAASISGEAHDRKDQVLWAGFDKIELGSSCFKHVLLLGYSDGFQVLDVEDASNVREIVSRRDDPVTFLQMQPLPAKSEGCEGFRASHPLLLVVACDESKSSVVMQNGREGFHNGHTEDQSGNLILAPTAVRFYSLRSHSYVHVLRFRSTVYMVRCSSRVVAVGLAAQIYCFDALTLENKFSVLTHPVPQLGGQGSMGVNVGYGPMDVGSRWLAYASNSPVTSNTGRLSPKSLTPSPGVSPSTSPSSGSLMARYAMESSKQLAAGLINLSDMGYKTLSRYYQELVPDGSSSPVPSNSSWKAVRAQSHPSETDVAGMVIVKDVVSKAIVSQFRAHSSPISALSFDPSGTMLVTASIHGTHINIFRIMPCRSKAGSGTQTYEWSSSHVHLYKLHRGMTSAVIQDICFSHYSQWIAIVSSKGTSHIFLLSPFGGETVLQMQNSHVGQPTLSPALSQPWWSTPSFMINHQSSTPTPTPPPITLYVVSRIKNSNSGWLHTVSNAASPATGKVSVPSGAVATVFYSSTARNLEASQSKVQALEHLLVYSPSGHLVQYELLPPVGGESTEAISRIPPSSPLQVQDEELRVKVETLQWWDVCRRSDWPEREESVSGIASDGQASEMVMDMSDSEDTNAGDKESEKSYEHSHLYIANAEVQMSFGRIPIWQQSKIHFHAIGHEGAEERILIQDDFAGELEIEKVPVHEIEIRRKDLLPVFDHFQRYNSAWSERGFNVGTFSPPYFNMDKEKSSENGVISYPKLDSSVENSDAGCSQHPYPATVSTELKNHGLMNGHCGLAPALLKQSSLNKDSVLVSSEHYMLGSPPADCKYPNIVSSLPSGSLPAQRSTADGFKPSDSGGASEVSNTSSNRSDSSMNIMDEGLTHGSLEFEPYFQEGYYQASAVNKCCDSVEAAADVDSNSNPCEREKSEEDGDNDDLLGGVFAFSEEG